MKIKEIITERIGTKKLRKTSIKSLPNAEKWPELDNSSPYHAYRFGVALAGAPEHDMDRDGPTGQSMMTVGYTDADEEILNRAGRNLGFKSKKLSSDGSLENDKTNTCTPVANRKPNKYGV